MKKILLGIFLFIAAFALSTQAQPLIDDDMESYELDWLNAQSDHWTTWDGSNASTIDSQVSDEQASSGDQSLKIDNSGIMDMLLLCGNQNSGNYDLGWNMYIPANSTAYFNIQTSETPGQAWLLDMNFGTGANPATETEVQNPGVGLIQQLGLEFNYPEDQWFPVALKFRADDQIIDVTVDGVFLAEVPVVVIVNQVPTGDPGALGGVNFYSINTACTYFIDDVLLEQSPVRATVHCDMNFQEISEDGVFVAGSFNDWDPSATPMSDDDGDGIYTAVITGMVGDLVDYKFVNGAIFEIVPDACGAEDDDGNINRQISLDADVELEAVCFSECENCDLANNIDVTFSVDMNFEEVDLETGVHLTGSFADWDPSAIAMTDADGDGVFDVTVRILENAMHEYKFVNGNSWDAPSMAEFVPEDCGVADGGGNINRSLTTAEEAITLETICFAGCTDCTTENSRIVTFSVGMANETVSADGVKLLIDGFTAFDPADPSAISMELVAGSNDIYSATVSLFRNNSYQYTFVNGASLTDLENVFGLDCVDGNGLRNVDLGAEDTSTEVVCFGTCDDNCTWNTGLGDIEQNSINIFPNPASDLVMINHEFTNAQSLSLEVYNSLGQLIDRVVSIDAANNQIQYNVEQLSSDLYFIKVTDGNKVAAQRLIVTD